MRDFESANAIERVTIPPMFKVLTLNNIAVEGLRRLPREHYETGSGVTNPDAVILRSFNMHDMDIPKSVVAIGRAGAGVNNIPVEAMSSRGVPVFNAPGRQCECCQRTGWLPAC